MKVKNDYCCCCGSKDILTPQATVKEDHSKYSRNIVIRVCDLNECFQNINICGICFSSASNVIKDFHHYTNEIYSFSYSLQKIGDAFSRIEITGLPTNELTYIINHCTYKVYEKNEETILRSLFTFNKYIRKQYLKKALEMETLISDNILEIMIEGYEKLSIFKKWEERGSISSKDLAKITNTTPSKLYHILGKVKDNEDYLYRNKKRTINKVIFFKGN